MGTGMLVAAGECGAAGVRPRLLCYKMLKERVLVFLFSLPCVSAEVTPARLGYFCFPEVTNPNVAKHALMDRSTAA